METTREIPFDERAQVGELKIQLEIARLERELELRYRGQQWSLRTAVDALDRAAIRASFEADHERRFGHIQPGGTILVTAVRVVATGHIRRQPPLPAGASGVAAPPVDHRRCFIDTATGWVDTPVHAADGLPPGASLTGPAIVEAATTTLLVGNGDRLKVDAHGNYLIETGGRP